ncbi:MULTISPECIES: RHS repeat protein [unclassified Photorhabdus]|uniref:RHS repeat protein n=1 Tax=unclassified Photorhabdus TaxID=2620880 RepID=UPI000DCE5745|nr:MULTISPECIES: RHS repeat domain-containing protein [unclassified Photorhabdus]RAX01108.1 toxin [Photorhabdus sp. S9-53]RAX01605.1 toxin [Photorhabdus sp. S10-54]RAX05020.1 toxin [Photorhabdus sp. S8-52]
MKNIDPKLYQKTPIVNVQDNRGLTIRNIDFHRTTANGDTDTRITRHQYNAHGHLSQSIDPRLYEVRQTNSTIKPNFLWQYDLTGNPLRTESIDAGRTVTLNDIEGRPLLTVTATGVIQTRQYEISSLPGRLLSVTEQIPEEKTSRITERLIWAGNSEAEKNHNLAGQCVRHYDTAGVTRLESLSLTGTVLSQSSQLLIDTQEANWTGDNETVWQNMLADDIYTILSTFDTTGALLTQTDAKGNIQRLAYDVAGQLNGSGLTVKGQTEQVIIKSLTYSAAGQKLREEHGNGVITEYSYEPETQWLIGIKTRRPSNTNPLDSKVLQDLRYQYDPVGNVISIRNDAEATRFWHNQKVVPENTYTYDSLYQLTSATGREMANIGQQSHQFPSPALPSDNNTYTNYTRTYIYDRGGNLTKIQHSSPATQNNYTTDITVSNRSNRAVLSTLTEDPAQVDALFDAGGHQNILTSGQSLNWNTRGELQQVTLVKRDKGTNDDREWYRYSGDGKRTLKVNEQRASNNAQIQRITYLSSLELRLTQNNTTTTEDLQIITVGEAGRAQVRVLHWESGKPADISNNQLRYSYDNLIGSSQLELDSEGQIISEEEYYPYGGTALWAARNQTEASYKTIRYSGKERDATGLYYYGYRYYQPWVGRWLSADPAGTVDGLNLYRMVRNNPIKYHDTDGRAPEIKDVEHTVIYGFSHHRGSEMGKAFAANKNPVTIDEYNAGLGIMGELSLSDYFRISQNLKEDSPPKLNEGNIRANSLKYLDAIGIKADSATDKTKQEAYEQQYAYTASWSFHMVENKGKLDIQSKIKSLLPKKSLFSGFSGKERYQKLDAFILKNSDGSDFTIQRQRDILTKFASAGNAGELESTLSTADQSWLKNTIATAFFRQTSKLGMDWFIKQLASPDFRFVMAGYNGEKLTIEQLNSDKPWKTGKRRKEGPHEYAEAITFSEIRHAYRKGYNSKINFIQK